jgi:hypothetical protein
MKRVAIAGLLALLSQGVHADEIDDLTAAEDKMYEAWDKVPLTDRKVIFTKESAAGYGVYEERANASFKGGEPIVTYIEPVGYAWKELPGDMYEINFVCDLKLKDANGQVLMEKAAFANTSIKSHNANTEAFIDLTLTVNGLPAGKYAVDYIVHDPNGGEDMTVTQNFDYTP